MQASATYHIRLPDFEGPLDLLLQLIEREKLDISAISLAQVADQFLAYMRELEHVPPEILADFLVVAARLVWIKSRLLLPQSGTPDEEVEEDPAEALARQLREYKRFKAASEALRALEEAGRHAYPRIAPPPEFERRLDQSSVTLSDLLAAAGRALAAMPAEPLPNGVAVVPFTLTIDDQIRLIRRATSDSGTITFRALLQQARHRLEIIVTLLAVLELIKRRQVNVSQDGIFGEIIISRVEGVEITEEEPTEEFENAGR